MPDVKIDFSDYIKGAEYLKLVGSKAPQAVARALNRTGAAARTQVARAIAHDISLGVRMVQKYLKVTHAAAGHLEYDITASGKPVPMRMFNPEQQAAGVSVKFGGSRTVLPHTFMVSRFGKGVYERVGAARLPIQQVVGPSIPEELVKDIVVKEFDKAVSERFAPALRHEVDFLISKGVVDTS